jgi:peptidoglycan/LPS O-acetylase OafA/YrhL
MIRITIRTTAALDAQPPREPQPVYLRTIDGLRGLAILLVLCARVVQLIANKLGAQWSFEVRVLLWLLVLVTVATLSYRLYEAPILALKARLTRALAPAPPAAPERVSAAS